MKLFVLLGILFSFSSFSKELKSPIFVKNCKEGKKCVWIEEIKPQYDPSFECNVESLNKDIESYIKFMYSKLKEEADKNIYALSHEQSNTAEENIRFSAYKHYIKQCDNFTDFVSDQKAGDPELDSEIGYFYSTSKNLDYMLRIIAEERDIETLKKLLDAGLNIDILFEVPPKLFHDDFYNLHGYVNFYENPEKHNTDEAIAFTKFLIEQGSKGTIEQ